MKKYFALVQYNEEYEFEAECESPQEFIDFFIERGIALEVKDHGMTDEPLIEKITVYEADEDGEPNLDQEVAEWNWGWRDCEA